MNSSSFFWNGHSSLLLLFSSHLRGGCVMGSNTAATMTIMCGCFYVIIPSTCAICVVSLFLLIAMLLLPFCF